MRWRSAVGNERWSGSGSKGTTLLPAARGRSFGQSAAAQEKRERRKKSGRAKYLDRTLGRSVSRSISRSISVSLHFCSLIAHVSLLPRCPLSLSRLIRPGPSAASVSPCLASWQFLAALRVNKTVAASLAGLAHAGVTRTLT